MQPTVARATERSLQTLEGIFDTVDVYLQRRRGELAELRGFVLVRRSPIALAMALLVTVPALILSIAFLTAAEWLPHQWPTPQQAGDVAATVSDWMLGLTAFLAVAAIADVLLRRGGRRTLASARQLHVVTSPLNRTTIARTPQPSSRSMINPIQRPIDVAALVADRSAGEAMLLLALAAELALAGGAPAVLTAALLAGAAPTVLERLIAATQLLLGLRDRARDGQLAVELGPRHV